ncbi:MAG: sulfatase, partial [Chloroflexi bacterium]|nr:sulfatase [Chloroflexota bacterium]
MSPTRRRVLESAGLLALAGILRRTGVGTGHRVQAWGPPATPPRPNIVLILTDDLDQRLDTVAHMPLLHEHIAAQGVTFTNCIANTPLCLPSRVSILRGQYTHNHRIYSNPAPTGGYEKVVATGLEASTLATVLHDSGYRTAFFGKYLNGYPLEGSETQIPPGWDEWVAPIFYKGSAAFDYEVNVNGQLVFYGSAPEDYLTDVLADYATRFIADACSAEAPFFAMLSTCAPHAPAICAPRHAELFSELGVPRTPSFNEEDVSDKHAAVANLTPIQPTGISTLDDSYRSRLRSVQAVDEAIAGIV